MTKKIDQELRYKIKIKGKISPTIAEWFGKITITSVEKGETLLVGQFSDQAALRGFLDQLWNLNFSILSLEQIVSEYYQDVTP